MRALTCAFSFAFSIAVGIPSPVAAQSSKTADQAVPLYRSPFSAYRGMTEEKVKWKEANDAVGRIGGWRAYLRESQGIASNPAAKSQDSKKPTPESAGGIAPAPSGGTHKH